MLRVFALTVALLLQQANCFSFPYSQASGLPVGQFYVYDTPMVAQPVPEQDKTPGLPCPSAGFFAHPANCRKFYRCVDYAETGTVFSTYEFECPAGNSFVKGKDTCVPSDCTAGSVVPSGAVVVATQPQVDTQASAAVTYPPEVTQPSPQPSPQAVTYPPQVTTTQAQAVTYPPEVTAAAGSQQAGAAAGSQQAGAAAGSQQTGEAAGSQQTGEAAGSQQAGAAAGSQQAGIATGVQPGTAGQGFVQPGIAYPQPGGASPVSSDDASVAAAPVVVEAQPSTCPKRFVQDEQYCNIYLPCPDDGRRYICTMGSVFNQEGQLCDLYNKEVLCEGKMQREEGSAARSGIFIIESPRAFVPSGQVVHAPLVYRSPIAPFQNFYHAPVAFRG